MESIPEHSTDEWTFVARSPIPQTGGPDLVFVEARLRDEWKESEIPDDICTRLEATIVQEFESLVLEKELLDEEGAFAIFSEYLLSLMAVEYTGQPPASASSSSTFVALKDGTEVRVQLYRMHSGTPEPEDTSFSDALLHAEVITLPSSRFKGLWETLIFHEDLRNGLVLTLTNMVKFAKRLGSNNSQMNRLVLLYGHPGTGKSSLCQALAQKISIRLQFKSTKLVQINAATLLSKYFSESALQIHRIFMTIEKMCRSNDDIFVCVLIDEIESLAASRTAAAGRNETHDSIRATNALLTGLDRIKSQPNLIILATSNLVKTLDAAFMDRCGLVISVDPPSTAAAYEIIRGGLKKLVHAKIVESESELPSFRDAQLAWVSQPECPGSRLLSLVEKLLGSKHACLVDGQVISGRMLGQLPEQALSRSLREDSCSLQRAIDLMDKFIGGQRRKGQKRKFEEMVPDPTPSIPAVEAGRSTGATATALFDYVACEDDELSFKKGTIIADVERKGETWLQGTYNGRTGFFKNTLVQYDELSN